MTGNHIIIAIIHVMKYHKRFEKPYIFLVTLSANSQGSLEIALPMVVRNSKSLYKCLHVFYCFLLFSHRFKLSMFPSTWGFHGFQRFPISKFFKVTPPHIQKTRPQFLEELLSLIKSNLTPQYCGKRNSKPAQYPTYLTGGRFTSSHC